jgi:competence protein ComEC
LFASDRRQQPAPPAQWKAALVGLLHEQAVITLALTPLTLLLFGQFSVVGLLANLLAIPWVTLVVTPLAMLGVAWAPLWTLCTWALQALDVLLQALNAMPFAAYSVALSPLYIGAIALLGGICLALRLPTALRWLGVPLLLPLLLWQAPRPVEGEFELIAADIGQGTAVVVRTAHHSLLYDTGPRFGADSDAGHRVLVPLLRALDERLDMLVLSHRDIDHTGGAPAVLAQQPQAQVLSSIEAEHKLQALRPAERCLAGQHWQWDGVDFEILHPQPQDYANAAAGLLKTNGLSCVLRIATAQAHGLRSALLTGDIEQPQEAALVQGLAGADATKLKADVLLVPHHGSKTSSSDAFLAAVAPRTAVVQAGYRNRFGHPVASVLERYQARGIAVVDSAHCGAATWSSAVPESVRCERLQAPRYWRHHVH